MAIYRNWGDSISLNMFELGKKHLVIIHWHFLGRSTVVPEKQSKALTASVDSWRKRPRSHWPGDNVKTWYAPWSKHGILMVYETWADGHWYIDIYIYIDIWYGRYWWSPISVFQALVKTWYVDGHPIQNRPEIMGDHPSPWIDMMTIPQLEGNLTDPVADRTWGKNQRNFKQHNQ